MHPFYRQRNRDPSWHLNQVSCFQPRTLHSTPCLSASFSGSPVNLIVRRALPCQPSQVGMTHPLSPRLTLLTPPMVNKPGASLAAVPQLFSPLQRIPTPPPHGSPPSYRSANRGLERESAFPQSPSRQAAQPGSGPRSPGTQPSSCLFPTGSPLSGLPLKGP